MLAYEKAKKLSTWSDRNSNGTQIGIKWDGHQKAFSITFGKLEVPRMLYLTCLPEWGIFPIFIILKKKKVRKNCTDILVCSLHTSMGYSKEWAEVKNHLFYHFHNWKTLNTISSKRSEEYGLMDCNAMLFRDSPTYHLHLHSQKVSRASNQQKQITSLTASFYWILAWLTLQHWWWWQ